MSTIKTFWKYFLLFIIAFFLVNFLTNFAMKDHYKDITDYEIKTSKPEIEIIECKTEYTHGYIKADVKNNTGKHIQLKYLKIDFYNKDKKYIGTEYRELKYFNVNETISFNIDYNYENVNKFIVSIVDEKEKQYKIGFLNYLDELNINENEKKIGMLGTGLVAIYLLFP